MTTRATASSPGPYEVRVVGTEFELAWDPDGKGLTLSMSKGEVHLASPDGKLVTLKAGQALHLADGTTTNPRLSRRTSAHEAERRGGACALVCAATPNGHFFQKLLKGSAGSPFPFAMDTVSNALAMGQLQVAIAKQQLHSIEQQGRDALTLIHDSAVAADVAPAVPANVGPSVGTNRRLGRGCLVGLAPSAQPATACRSAGRRRCRRS